MTGFNSSDAATGEGSVTQASVSARPLGIRRHCRIETFSAQFLNRCPFRNGLPIPSANFNSLPPRMAVASATSLADLFLLLPLRLGFLLKQRLPVSDRIW